MKRVLAVEARAARCIVVGLVLVAACWRSSPPPPVEPPTVAQAPQFHPRRAPPARELSVLDRFDQFADDMCRCKDWNCAQQVAEDMTLWSQETAKEQADPGPSPDDKQRAAEIGTRIGECMKSAMTAGTAAGSAGPTP